MKLRWTAIGPAFVAIYFLILTGHAVQTYLSPDDFLGIYQPWAKSAAALVRANFLFFLPSDTPRPMTSAWYGMMYAIGGVHPAPYKIVNLAMLVVNILLSYSVARRLAKSRTAGTLAALLACYHPGALDLYFNTGFVCDVLCYLFYFSAANVYLRARTEDRFPTWRELAAVSALYLCALNSKEMAVTFPVFLLLYEVIYHARKPGREGLTAWRQRLPQAAGILATGTITLVWLIGKMSASVSLLHSNAMYRPNIGWHQFALTSGNFAGNLFLSRRRGRRRW